MLTQKEFKKQENWLTKKIIFLIFYKDLSSKKLITKKNRKKIAIQVSIRWILKNFKEKYSKTSIHRILNRLIKSKIIEVVEISSQKNQGNWYTLNDKWYDWAWNKALKNPNYKIPEILKNAGHENISEYQQVKNISPIEMNAGHGIEGKVIKSQEVKIKSPIYNNIISNDIIKRNDVNKTSSFSFSKKYFQRSPTPKSKEEIRKEFSHQLTKKEIEHACMHFEKNPGKNYGWYYKAGKEHWNLPFNREEIIQENKHLGMLIAKKIISLPEFNQQIEALNKYLEISCGIYSEIIEYQDPNFEEKINIALKKRNLPSLKELGVIAA